MCSLVLHYVHLGALLCAPWCSYMKVARMWVQMYEEKTNLPKNRNETLGDSIIKGKSWRRRAPLIELAPGQCSDGAEALCGVVYRFLCIRIALSPRWGCPYFFGTSKHIGLPYAKSCRPFGAFTGHFRSCFSAPPWLRRAGAGLGGSVQALFRSRFIAPPCGRG